jgi:predicted MPP superfamily phosphohydrolase
MLRWLIVIVVFLLIEIYAFQALKTASKNGWFTKSYIIINSLVFINLFYRIFNVYLKDLDYSDQYYNFLSIPFALFFTLFCFKLILISFLFFEDILRLIVSTYKFFFSPTESFLIDRRGFLSKIALLIASIPIPFVLHGIFKGRYNYKVYNYDLNFEDLPKEFDGYQITHISDIHSGSLNNIKSVEYAVELINEQNSDLILFTGDIVNNRADELDVWKNTLSKIEANDGKYSVLGNHDYGDYVNWKFEHEKKDNFEKLLKIQNEMGFNLLMNENINIKRNQQSISLIGVENWGKGRFKKKGDIDTACNGLNENDFKIVMSHDPSHWDEILKNHKTHFHLTLSGHTHGMQFGIEIPGWIKWSPAKWAYKHWAGLYNENKQFLNVNRGFGVLGFPGRVGIPPEISVITLKKS